MCVREGDPSGAPKRMRLALVRVRFQLLLDGCPGVKQPLGWPD